MVTPSITVTGEAGEKKASSPQNFRNKNRISRTPSGKTQNLTMPTPLVVNIATSTTQQTAPTSQQSTQPHIMYML